MLQWIHSFFSNKNHSFWMFIFGTTDFGKWYSTMYLYWPPLFTVLRKFIPCPACQSKTSLFPFNSIWMAIHAWCFTLGFKRSNSGAYEVQGGYIHAKCRTAAFVFRVAENEIRLAGTFLISSTLWEAAVLQTCRIYGRKVPQTFESYENAYGNIMGCKAEEVLPWVI